MKTSPTSVNLNAPVLRLVNAEGPSAASVLRLNHAAPDLDHHLDHQQGFSGQARREGLVATENQAAAGLSALDPRWIFAVQVAKCLDGGRAAILRPEVRQKLVASATRLGLRPFDANLVIAVVQDGARTGDGPLSHETEGRLRLVRPVQSRAIFSESTLNLIVSGTTAAVAVGLFLFALNWLKGT